MGNDFATFTSTNFTSVSNHTGNYLVTHINIKSTVVSTYMGNDFATFTSTKFTSVSNHMDNDLVTHIN